MPDTARIQRFTRDAALILTKALPAANASNTSDALDLGAVEPGRMVDDFDVKVEIPATPSLVDAKAVTVTVQDSADGSSFAPVPAVAPIVVTGAGGSGGAAVDRIFKLPPTVRQFVRFASAVETGGGNNTGVSVSLSLLF